MSDSLLREQRGGVLQLTLNRPQKKNAIDNPLWRAIGGAFLDAAADDSVRCVLLTGAGESFSAGVDLSSFTDPDRGEEHPFEAAARAVADFDKPLVAAARGIAVGGGATVLCHADMVYVGESLRLRLPFAALALPPEWASSYMLQANIGAQRAAELFYTADWVDAARAVQLGLALEALPDEQLQARAMDRAQAVARWPLTALREIKRCLRLPHRAGIAAAFTAEREAMQRQAGSPDNLEAVMALLEKREPRFE
jgi:enoyl-CoA hydratase/carnithine racemase